MNSSRRSGGAQRRRAPAAPPLALATRMAPTDALFWYAESAVPAFRPIIAGLHVLDRAPDPDAIASGTELAVAAVPRLRQRVVEAPLGLGLPEWQDDPHFDPAYHLRHVSLPAPNGMRELLDLVAAIFATPLDRQRPLWEATWIDGLEGGRSALLFKLHHSVVDGVGSIAILDALTSERPDAGPVRARHPKRGRAAPTPSSPFATRLAALAIDQARTAATLASRAARAPFAALVSPRASIDTALRTARGLLGMASDLGRPPTRDPLAVAGSGLSRRLDVAELPLERLRKLKDALGVTINDAVLAALAGTLHAYHRERRVHADELACLVPMNLRGRGEGDALGNRVGMFTIALPVGESRPARRLARIVEQTAAAKSDRRGAAAPFLVEALAALPGAVLRQLARGMLGRVNVACTNVPGTPAERWMAGARVESIYPFASVVEGTPLVVALLSYADKMEIGIDTDPEAIPDPHRIAALFEASIAELEALG